MIAVHNPFEECPLHATCSVEAALRIKHSTQRLNKFLLQEFISCGVAPGSIKIGISTSRALAGTVGTQERLSFTTIGSFFFLFKQLLFSNLNKIHTTGSCMSVANRLKTLNKIYGTQILISQSTAFHLKKEQTPRIHQSKNSSSSSDSNVYSKSNIDTQKFFKRRKLKKTAPKDIKLKIVPNPIISEQQQSSSMRYEQDEEKISNASNNDNKSVNSMKKFMKRRTFKDTLTFPVPSNMKFHSRSNNSIMSLPNIGTTSSASNSSSNLNPNLINLNSNPDIITNSSTNESPAAIKPDKSREDNESSPTHSNLFSPVSTNIFKDSPMTANAGNPFGVFGDHRRDSSQSLWHLSDTTISDTNFEEIITPWFSLSFVDYIILPSEYGVVPANNNAKVAGKSHNFARRRGVSSSNGNNNSNNPNNNSSSVNLSGLVCVHEVVDWFEKMTPQKRELISVHKQLQADIFFDFNYEKAMKSIKQGLAVDPDCGTLKFLVQKVEKFKDFENMVKTNDERENVKNLATKLVD